MGDARSGQQAILQAVDQVLMPGAARRALPLALIAAAVTAVGLVEDSLVAILAAMLVMPLAGPILGLALGSALGDAALLKRASLVMLAILGMVLGLSVVIGLLWPVDLQRGIMLLASAEILARTDVRLDAIALALGAGTATALMAGAGISLALPGVMVAIAVVPSWVSLGLLAGGGHGQLALGAGLLAIVSLLAVVAAAKLVLMVQGVRPGAGAATAGAQAGLVYVAFWGGVLVLLLAVMVVRLLVVL